MILNLLVAEPPGPSAIDRFAAALARPAAHVRPIVPSFVRDCLSRSLLVPD